MIQHRFAVIATLGATLLMLIAATIAPAASDTNPTDTPLPSSRLLIENIKTRLSGAAGMAAEFEQVNYWVVMDEADTARGSLLLSPPHRFRLEYEIPQGHLVGCDGASIWTFIPEEKQVLHSALHHTTGWGNFFLEGLDSHIDSSAVMIHDPDGGERILIDLGAHSQWGLKRLYIEIDLDSGDPAAYSYEDDEGNTTRFNFISVRFPGAFSERDFIFNVPEGYERLDVD